MYAITSYAYLFFGGASYFSGLTDLRKFWQFGLLHVYLYSMMCIGPFSVHIVLSDVWLYIMYAPHVGHILSCLVRRIVGVSSIADRVCYSSYICNILFENFIEKPQHIESKPRHQP